LLVQADVGSVVHVHVRLDKAEDALVFMREEEQKEGEEPRSYI